MAEKLTPQQEMAVHKIASKLTERIAQMPENRHLQNQMQRLFLTKISTVHSFCGDILREYAYLLDLSADFRMADENECMELQQLALDQILDEAYENAGLDPDFRAFVDTQGLGRDDRLVPQIIQKVYDSAMCHLDPDKWLEECQANASAAGVKDAGDTVWGRYLREDLFGYLDLQLEAMEKCANDAAQYPEWKKQQTRLADTLYQLRHLREASSWDEIVDRKNIDYGRLVFPKKNPDGEMADRIKAIRSACKDGVERKLRSFTDPSSLVL